MSLGESTPIKMLELSANKGLFRASGIFQICFSNTIKNVINNIKGIYCIEINHTMNAVLSSWLWSNTGSVY